MHRAGGPSAGAPRGSRRSRLDLSLNRTSVTRRERPARDARLDGQPDEIAALGQVLPYVSEIAVPVAMPPRSQPQGGSGRGTRAIPGSVEPARYCGEQVIGEAVPHSID